MTERPNLKFTGLLRPLTAQTQICYYRADWSYETN